MEYLGVMVYAISVPARNQSHRLAIIPNAERSKPSIATFQRIGQLLDQGLGAHGILIMSASA